jgi:hypothetical protein
MKTGFIGILNNPAKSLNSHSSGWNELIRLSVSSDSKILSEKDDWDEYDLLIINHGLNFKPGSFNVIGGISQEVHERSKKLINYKGRLLHVDGFQMSEFIKKRKLDYVYNKQIESFEITKKEKLLIGDSHSISVWPGEQYNIQRMDGKTLFGFLKSPIKADYIYFGNIDVRFHLCRQPDPISATRSLVKRYIEFAKLCNAKVSCLLPIESESRKLPGTGLYKGKKYYGTVQERTNLVDLFNNELLSSGLQVNEWPERWYKDLEFYEKEVMEPKQSVHLRPRFYANKNNTILNLQDNLTLGI